MIVDLTVEEMQFIAYHAANVRSSATMAIQTEKSFDDDPAYSERYITGKTREVEQSDALLAKLGMECVNVWAKDDWGCVCGNRQDTVGFYACDRNGEACEPKGEWAGHYWCAACGRVIDGLNGLVTMGEDVERIVANTQFELALVDAKRPAVVELDDAPVGV